MGCWHGCGPWHGGPYWSRWYAGPEWEPYDDEDELPVVRRRRRRVGRVDRAMAAEDLEARLEVLKTELERVQQALADLGAEPTTSGE